MGLDLREISIPRHSLALYQAGIRYLFPVERQSCAPEAGVSPLEHKEPEYPSFQEQGYPLPWAAVWKRLSPPYAMIWTYWQLSEDLGPAADTQRTQLFKTILSKLCWPKGSVAFWPLSRFENHTHTPRLDMFWAGVQAVQAQLVVVFGAQAFRVLFPNKEIRFGFTNTPGGLQIVHVPGPEDMLPDNREMKNLAWNMLCPLAPVR